MDTALLCEITFVIMFLFSIRFMYIEFMRIKIAQAFSEFQSHRIRNYKRPWIGTYDKYMISDAKLLFCVWIISPSKMMKSERIWKHIEPYFE